MKLHLPLLLFCVPFVAGCGAQKSVSASSPVAAMLRSVGLEGRVALVEFGMVGCALSGDGLDSMVAWQSRKAFPDLSFIRLDPTADQKVFDDYFGPRSLGFPVVRDTAMAVAKALGTTVYPQFVLLDKFGHVRYRGAQPAPNELSEWATTLASETADPGANAPQFGTVTLDVPALLGLTRLPALDGGPKTLADYRRPNGLLLVFADTRCPFSATAARQIPEVAAVLARRGVPTVLVNVGEDEARVRSFYGTGITGATVVYDTGKAEQQRWNVQFVPTAVLVDSAGELVYRGSPVWEHITEKVAAALNLPADSVKTGATGTSGG